MEAEFKVRKPKEVKFLGIYSLQHERYVRRKTEWLFNMLPNNGDKIKITLLPSCKNVPKGTPNPYIGMEGIVEDLNINGDFVLNCGGCYLVCAYTDFNYIKL